MVDNNLASQKVINKPNKCIYYGLVIVLAWRQMGWATKQATSIVWHSFSPLSRIIIKANQDHQNWVSWEICSERNPFSSDVIMWHLKFWNNLYYLNSMISYLKVTNHPSCSLTDPNSLISLLTMILFT